MPPRGGDASKALAAARELRGKVHAINITDGSRAIMRMSSLAVCKLLLEENIEPILQITCRDKNRIGLQAEILGANALGIKNILCITGDSVKAGDQQETKAVHEFESVRLLRQIQAFNQGIDPTFGKLADQRTNIFSGAAANPNLRNQRSLQSRTRQKKEPGANFLQTQMVMERNYLIEFCERISKPLDIPVIAGVFLLKSYKNALFINKYVPGANIPEKILNRLKDAKDPLKEGIQIAAEQAKDYINIAEGIHIMAVKAEHLIPQIIEMADINLEYLSLIHI